MKNVMGGSVRESRKFEGFEQRLLDELKIMVAERRIEVIEPAGTGADGTIPVGASGPGGSPFRTPAWRRAGLVGAVGLAAGAMTVAALFAGGLVSSGPAASGSEHIDVTAFLAKAAAAARSHPVAPSKPGQVFVELVKAGETGPKILNKVGCVVMVYDTPATGRAPFPTKSGSCRARETALGPFIAEILTSGHQNGAVKHGHEAQGYPNPAKLPTNPGALLAALDHAASRGNWNTGTIDLADLELYSRGLESRNAIVFGLIERLLQVPVRPALRAALFEVTGRLHGITLDRHATDLTGRPGVGISLPLPIKRSRDGLQLEFVLNAKTYRFLGVALTDSINGDPAHPDKYGYAVIRSFLTTPKPAKH